MGGTRLQWTGADPLNTGPFLHDLGSEYVTVTQACRVYVRLQWQVKNASTWDLFLNTNAPGELGHDLMVNVIGNQIATLSAIFDMPAGCQIWAKVANWTGAASTGNPTSLNRLDIRVL
jgi:hypothetical protein